MLLIFTGKEGTTLFNSAIHNDKPITEHISESTPSQTEHPPGNLSEVHSTDGWSSNDMLAHHWPVAQWVPVPPVHILLPS